MRASLALLRAASARSVRPRPSVLAATSAAVARLSISRAVLRGLGAAAPAPAASITGMPSIMPLPATASAGTDDSRRLREEEAELQRLSAQMCAESATPACELEAPHVAPPTRTAEPASARSIAAAPGDMLIPATRLSFAERPSQREAPSPGLPFEASEVAQHLRVAKAAASDALASLTYAARAAAAGAAIAAAEAAHSAASAAASAATSAKEAVRALADRDAEQPRRQASVLAVAATVAAAIRDSIAGRAALTALAALSPSPSLEPAAGLALPSCRVGANEAVARDTRTSARISPGLPGGGAPECLPDHDAKLPPDARVLADASLADFVWLEQPLPTRSAAEAEAVASSEDEERAQGAAAAKALAAKALK